MRVTTERTPFIRAGPGGSVKPGRPALAAAAAALAAAACGFTPGGAPGDGGTGDAGPDAGDAGGDAPVAGPCDPADADLRACFDFEGGQVLDRSGSGLTVAATTAGPIAGAVGDAVLLDAGSEIHVTESPALDVTAPLALEMFVRVDQAPPPTGPSQRAGLIDNNRQYSLFVNDAMRVYCTIGATVFGPNLAVGRWHHVACVQDQGRLYLYVDGALFGSVANPDGNVSTAGGDGTNLGSDLRGNGTAGDRLIGGLDELRVWARARSADEIAAEAARGLP